MAGRGGGGGTHTHTFGGDPRPGQGSTVVPTGGWERAAGGSAVPAQPSPGKSLLAAPPRPLATEPRGSRPLRFPQRPAVSRVVPPPPFPFISSEKPFPVGLRPPRQPAGTPRGCEAGGWVGWATPPTATGAVSPPSCVCRPPPPSLLLSKPRGVSLRPRGALLWVGRWGLNSPTPRHQSPESL